MNDNAIKKIIFNISAIAGSNMVSRICGLILVIVLARYLGPEKYGIYSLSLAFYTLFLLFANWGMDTLIIRKLARQKELIVDSLGNVIGLKIAISLTSFLVLLFVVQLLGYRDTTEISIILMTFAIMPSCLLDSIKALATAYEQMAYVSVIEVMRSVLNLLIALTMVYVGAGVLSIVSSQVIAISMSLLIGLMVIQRKVQSLSGIQVCFGNWRTYFIKATPFFLISAIAILNNRVDILLISFFLEEKAVGSYSAAVTFVDILFFIPILICQVLFPTMTRLYWEDKQALAVVGSKALKLLVSLAVGLSVGLLLLSDKIILFVYGPQFSSSSIILKIFAFSILVEYGIDVILWLHIAIDREKFVLKANMVVMLINLMFNIILIPRFGLIGAAVTNVICSVSITLIAVLGKGEGLPLLSYFSNYIRPVLAALPMAFSIIFLYDFSVLLIVPVGGLVYLLFLYLFGGFDKQEITHLLKVVRSETEE